MIDYNRAGAPLVDGPLVPHDILRISGVEALQVHVITARGVVQPTDVEATVASRHDLGLYLVAAAVG